jgi:hypothetical protein
MKIDLIEEYCRSRNLSLIDGLALISAAVSKATNTRCVVTPEIDEAMEIGFYANNARPINMKPSTLSAASGYLEKMALAKENAKEIKRLNEIRQSAVVSGAIDQATNNGWFVILPELRAFMPLGEAIEEEASGGYYAKGSVLQFAVASSGIRPRGAPRVILSRRLAILAQTIAARIFAVYGFVSLKRQAGVKQTILLRAYPQKQHQAIYQAYFPAERVIFRKLLSDGTIAQSKRKDRLQ